MKANKHIKTLAAQIVKADQYASQDYTEQKLNDFREALLKGRFYVGVESVARSGMSRTLKLAIIKNNQLIHAPSYIYKMAGCNKNGVISGCGMDMCFAAQYHLFAALCPGLKYQDKMPHYHGL